MTIRSKVASWRTRRGPQSAGSGDPSLREFVYLDKVSLHSLLASRKGAITTEFTEIESASLNNQLAGGVSAGFGGLKAEAKTSLEGSQAHESQVRRKAIVETSFKEFRELESGRLGLTMPTGDPPSVASEAELQEGLDSLLAGGWVIEPSQLQRGALVEAEVILSPDPVYSATAAISTMRDLMEESPELFGVQEGAQLPEIRAIGGMFDKLLAGLVPLRCQLVDFEAVEIDGRDYLVHTGLVNKREKPGTLTTRPAFLVGVAQRDLFWKDIRRVLFSNGRYSMLCRISGRELARAWRPVKGIEALDAIHPVFNEYMRDIGAQFLAGVRSAFEASNEIADAPTDRGRVLVETFGFMLAQYHGKVLSAKQLSRLHASLPSSDASWPETVDSRRPVLHEVQAFVERELWAKTPREVAASLRLAAANEVDGPGGDPLTAETAAVTQAATPSSQPDLERFLDIEIVAIYW